MHRHIMESLKNELMKRGITLHKAAEITGIDCNLLRCSFVGDRELTAVELVTILKKTGIPIEKLFYKEPGISGAEIAEWNETEVMSKEYAIGIVENMWRFCKKLYFMPQIKPFNSEEDFVTTLQMLNGVKEFIQLRCEEQSACDMNP